MGCECESGCSFACGTSAAFQCEQPKGLKRSSRGLSLPTGVRGRAVYVCKRWCLALKSRNEGRALFLSEMDFAKCWRRPEFLQGRRDNSTTPACSQGPLYLISLDLLTPNSLQGSACSLLTSRSQWTTSTSNWAGVLTPVGQLATINLDNKWIHKRNSFTFAKQGRHPFNKLFWFSGHS